MSESNSLMCSIDGLHSHLLFYLLNQSKHISHRLISNEVPLFDLQFIFEIIDINISCAVRSRHSCANCSIVVFVLKMFYKMFCCIQIVAYTIFLGHPAV